jgi:hypothetical protein
VNARSSLLGAAGLLGVLGCRSAGIDGGRTEPAAARVGNRVAEYTVAECRDTHGKPVPAPPCRVARVRLATGRDVLVEERPGYDKLVLERARAEGKNWVFALTIGDGTRDRLMHELSIPMQPGRGRFRIADAFEGDAGDAEEPLKATAIALDCALVPRVSGSALDTREALE